jgi:hypothetical protein
MVNSKYLLPLSQIINQLKFTMMKVKVLSVIVVAMLGILPCFAGKALIIHLSDSTQIVCSLLKEPQMAFGEKSITLSSVEGTVGEWNFSEVLSWTFEEYEDVDEAIKEVEGKKLLLTATGIDVYGEKNIAIYDMSGKKMEVKGQTKDNTTSVSFSGMPKGAYVLKVGKNSVKFMVR